MKAKNLYVVHSRTSTNNGRLCITKPTKNPNIAQVQMVKFHDGTFHIQNIKFLMTYTSLKKVTVHDLVRNLDNETIESLIPLNILTLLANSNVQTEL